MLFSQLLNHALSQTQIQACQALKTASYTTCTALLQKLNNMSHPTFKMKFFSRDYELDQFGVVNHSVQVAYLEHVRHNFLARVGLIPDQIALQGNALAVYQLQLKFERPIVARESFFGTVKIEEISASKVVMEQKLLQLDSSEIVTGHVVGVYLDNNYKPTRIPKEYLQGYLEYVERLKQEVVEMNEY